MSEWLVAGVALASVLTVVLWDIYSQRGNSPRDKQSEHSEGFQYGTNGELQPTTSDGTVKDRWHPQEQHHRRIERRYWSRQNIIAAITLVFSIAAVGASGASAIFAWGALKASRQQIIIARDTERRQLRAYVIVTDFGVYCPDCGDTTLTGDTILNMKNSLRDRMENTGQTPAYQVTETFSWQPISGKGIRVPDRFAFEDVKQTEFVSRSDLGKDKHKDGAGELTTNDVRTFIEAGEGKTTLFLYGHVDYCDIFGEPHSTAYCFIYVKNGGLRLPLCDRFNGEIPARGICRAQP